MIEVAYRGRPRLIRDPDKAKDGWIATDHGAAAAGEPLGSPTRFPCNNYGNATIDEFIALAAARSGRRLDGLIRKWLFRPGSRDRPPLRGRR